MKRIEVIGKIFGELEVIEFLGKKGHDELYLCKCSCGKTREYRKSALTREGATSCGCKNDKIRDLKNKKFGKLTVIEKVIDKNNKPAWRCKCDCGNEITTKRNSLITGRTKSCGCARKGINKKHGHAHDKIYNVHGAMVKRCTNPNDKSFKNYGGRGITVCREWTGNNGFINFLNWAIKNGYKEGLSIDRIDNNEGYNPNNCRWTNCFVQARNKRVERINTTGISGVQERKDKKDYRVVITANGKRYSLGCYKDFQKAKEARRQGELKYWGFTNIQ